MARKRMFDSEIINQDSFYDLPMEAKAIYFLLGMEADDEGFASPKKILRLYGGTEDSIKILITKKFIIPFSTGVIVITDWKRNNYIDKTRFKETIYQEEKKELYYNEQSQKYEVLNKCLTDVKQMLKENRIDKNRLDKYSIDNNSIDNKNNKQEKNDSCVDGSVANESCEDDLQVVVDFYNNNIGLLTPFGFELFQDYLKQMPADLIILAMKKSVEANVRTIKYIKGILNNWEKKGIKTVLEAENEDEKFKNKNSKTLESEEEKTARRIKELGG